MGAGITCGVYVHRKEGPRAHLRLRGLQASPARPPQGGGQPHPRTDLTPQWRAEGLPLGQVPFS